METVSAGVFLAAARRELGFDIAAELDGINAFERWQCEQCGLIFFTPWQAGSNAFYSTLSKHSWYQPSGKWEYQAAAACVDAGSRVLDIGCGDGRFHASIIASADYTGLDPSATTECHKISPGARILNEALSEHSQQHPQTYDCVCAFQVLEHVADPVLFVKQALRCLRPGGQLILGLPNHETYLGGLMNFALNSPPHHLTWWSDSALAALEQELGLTRMELSRAPLEVWEHELYWMQRLYGWAVPRRERYSAQRRWRWFIPLGFIGAKLLARALPRVDRALGSTMLWVVTRETVTQEAATQ